MDTFLLGLNSSPAPINASANTDYWSGIAKSFQDYSGMIAVIALIITIAFFIFDRLNERRTRNKESKEIRRRSCNAILKEIEDHRDTLRNPDYEHEYVKRGDNIRYTRRILTSDAFKSVLHSGLFTHFQTETQNSLTNLYLRIRIKNDLIIYLNKFHDTFFLYDNSVTRQELYLQSISNYEISMTELEREIRVYLDGVSILIRSNEVPK